MRPVVEQTRREPLLQLVDRAIGRGIRDHSVDLYDASRILVCQEHLARAIAVGDYPTAVPLLSAWVTAVGLTPDLVLALGTYPLRWEPREWGSQGDIVSQETTNYYLGTKVLCMSRGTWTTRHNHLDRFEVHFALQGVEYLGEAVPEIHVGNLVGRVFKPRHIHRICVTGPELGLVLTLDCECREAA